MFKGLRIKRWYVYLPDTQEFRRLRRRKQSDWPQREILLHLLWAESSAVDKFNDTSLFSQLSGLRYLAISGQIYNRTVQALSRRFSHRNLFTFHYGHCYGWPISNEKIAISVEKYEKTQYEWRSISFKLIQTGCNNNDMTQ